MAEREYTVIGVDKHVYYGSCDSPAANATKNVIIQNPTIYMDQTNYFLDLNEGDLLIVSFESSNENNEPTLNLQIQDGGHNISFSNGVGRAVIGSNISEDCKNMWDAGDVVPFVYTVESNSNNNSEITYWKMTAVSPATFNKYGTVKIATENDDYKNGGNKTAITYGVLGKELNDFKGKLSLATNSSSAGSGNWIDVKLCYCDDPTSEISTISTISLPKPITNTSQLTNDGDGGADDSVYWSSNNNNYFIAPDLGIGYRYLDVSGNYHYVNNFIPQTSYQNKTAIRLGYGSLDAYQDEVGKRDGNEIVPVEPEPPGTWIYGGEIKLAMDPLESTEIGTIDLKGNRHVFTPLYSFDGQGAIFNRALTVQPSIETGSINADAINVSDELVVNNFQISRTTIEELIDAKTKLLSLKAATYGINPSKIDTTRHFIIRSYITPELYAKAYSSYKYYASTDKNHENPIVTGVSDIQHHLNIDRMEGYVPIAIAGWNIDHDTQKTTCYPSVVNIWECNLQAITGAQPYVEYALYNTWKEPQYTYLRVFVLYVKTEWGKVIIEEEQPEPEQDPESEEGEGGEEAVTGGTENEE